jgi:hypothetical protein
MMPRALAGVESKGADEPEPLSTIIGVRRCHRGWFISVALCMHLHDLVRARNGSSSSVVCKFTAAR